MRPIDRFRPAGAATSCVPKTAEVHVAFVYSFTVVSDCVEPVIVGVLLFAGEAGVEPSPLGAFGAMPSWMYVMPVEHADVFGPIVDVA